MCGILISKSNDPEIINSIVHRGIESKTIETKNGYYLTHHRLPIQTLDGDEWAQPYEYLPGKYLLFNGEIFNYPKIFNSDIEYLINFFKYSKNLVDQIHIINKWDGFWSIILFNENTSEIVVFTDPLGKKQLYINDNGEICSEIKGLIREDSVFDDLFFGSIYKWGYNYDDRTPFKNIKRILPNNIYQWNIKTPNLKILYEKYYTPNIIDIKDPNSELKSLFIESVTNRLISKNYPISVLLSGGLDSSIIGSILIKMNKKVDWYTIENEEDEKYIQLLEKEWGINVYRLKYSMDENDEEKNKEIYCKWNESPIDLGSVIPQYFLFEAVKKHSNHRIVISGDGADELFGGYKRINQYDSQQSDIFHELSYYHLPRLDKMSMAHTIELRTPFLSTKILDFACSLPYKERTNKKILKETFNDLVPESIINRPKFPLKNNRIRKEPEIYRKYVIDLFKNNYKKYIK